MTKRQKRSDSVGRRCSDGQMLRCSDENSRRSRGNTAVTGGFLLSERILWIMTRHWGRNPGLMERKLAQKARFTCVASAFDTSGHRTIGPSDHPSMCRPRSLFLFSAVCQPWLATRSSERSAGEAIPHMVRWSDGPMVRWPLAEKPFTAKAFLAGESSLEAVDFRCCHPQLWNIIKQCA